MLAVVRLALLIKTGSCTVQRGVGASDIRTTAGHPPPERASSRRTAVPRGFYFLRLREAANSALLAMERVDQELGDFVIYAVK